MEVPGPCSECGRTAILHGCPLCGAQVCDKCLATRRHLCALRRPEDPEAFQS